MNNEVSMNDERWTRFEELRDAALDGRISAVEVEALESLVLGDDSMRRNYAEHVHQQAALRLSLPQAMPAMFPIKMTDLAERQQDVIAAPSAGGSRWQQIIGYVISIAAVALLAVGLTYSVAHNQSDQPIAMITSAENCRWGDCTLATTERMPLGSGTLRLESGIATLRFPNVNVTLEGKTEIEIINPKECFVHSGRVFANVEQGGEGFVIQTPTANFVDRGTTFGVRVGPGGISDLTVIKGRVDVNHRATSMEAVVRVNERLRASSESLLEIGKGNFPASDDTGDPSAGLPIHVSTASGTGDDIYLSAGDVVPANSSTTALLVKKPAKSNPGQWYAPWRRKAFMRIDLSGVKTAEIVGATLQLQGVATNIGFASMMPDARFAVYGLVDESQDNWESETITWLNCPANAGDAIAVDRKATMLLGKFVVPQSSPEGRFEISGSSLMEFIQSDTNGQVTFILIPESVGEEGESYVHGFASKRHPFLAAPTLRMRVN